MLRTTLLSIVAVVFLTMSFQCLGAPRPNVILLMADDMGWGDLSFRGHPNLETPTLDDMAASGVVFDRFYSAAPVCSPTRASVLTGRHPFRSGIFFAMVPGVEQVLPRKEVTLGRLFRDAGYRTGFFGKWHLGTLSTDIADGRFGGPDNTHLYSPPWEHGFESVFATESRVPTYDPQLRPRSQSGAEPDRHPVVEVEEGTVRGWWPPLEDKRQGVFWGTRYWTGEDKPVQRELHGDDSGIIVDEAIEFVAQEANDGQPFLAVVWFHTPHLPLVASPEEHSRYGDHEFFDRTYYGAVSAMDREIGRLRDALKALGLADNTVLWFTSDNGPEGLQGIAPGSAGGLRGRKRSLYEGGIRVPGIVEWPAGIQAGSRAQVPAVTTDIFPTVLGLAGIDVPAGRALDGKDLREIMSGKAEARRAPIGFESQHQLAWIDDRYKLVFIPSYDGPARQQARLGPNPATSFDFELYDIADDPGETTDLASQHSEVVERMAGQLARWRQSVAASAAGDEPGESGKKQE
ncbi:MAG: sulfatase-like hydrolase/transferase [Pseudomonadota bacterium]